MTDQLTTIIGDLERAAQRLKRTRSIILTVIDDLQPMPTNPPWDRDIRDELPRNHGPWPKPDGSPSLLDRDGGWWPRRLAQIIKATYHHTLSDDPFATAAHYIVKADSSAVGRPSIPYTIWITQTGEVLLCVSLEEGLWHDHTGHENVHLSIGLAGSLHLYHPSEAQLDAAARVGAWTIQSPDLPSITSIDDITGHMDWIGTQCPGWIYDASGHWKSELYTKIEALL